MPPLKDGCRVAEKSLDSEHLHKLVSEGVAHERVDQNVGRRVYHLMCVGVILEINHTCQVLLYENIPQHSIIAFIPFTFTSSLINVIRFDIIYQQNVHCNDGEEKPEREEVHSLFSAFKLSVDVQSFIETCQYPEEWYLMPSVSKTPFSGSQLAKVLLGKMYKIQVD